MILNDTLLTVRYAETDQMKVVHHSNYAVWFEAARSDFIRKMGYPYSRIESEGLMLPLIELRCVYKGSARYEDVICIRTRLAELSPLRMHFNYLVYVFQRAGDYGTMPNTAETEGGMYDPVTSKPICEGDTFHVWTDNNLKPINIKKAKPAIYEVLCEALNGVND